MRKDKQDAMTCTQASSSSSSSTGYTWPSVPLCADEDVPDVQGQDGIKSRLDALEFEVGRVVRRTWTLLLDAVAAVIIRELRSGCNTTGGGDEERPS